MIESANRPRPKRELRVSRELAMVSAFFTACFDFVYETGRAVIKKRLPMIDVKELIAKYSLQELNDTADEYYKSINLNDLSIKPFRLPEIKHLLVELSYLIYLLDIRPGDRVLDFGCGTGWTSRILYACGCDVVALDVSEVALAAARSISERWQTAGLSGPYGGGVKLEFKRFDGVTMDVGGAT